MVVKQSSREFLKRLARGAVVPSDLALHFARHALNELLDRGQMPGILSVTLDEPRFVRAIDFYGFLNFRDPTLQMYLVGFVADEIVLDDYLSRVPEWAACKYRSIRPIGGRSSVCLYFPDNLSFLGTSYALMGLGPVQKSSVHDHLVLKCPPSRELISSFLWRIMLEGVTRAGRA